MRLLTLTLLVGSLAGCGGIDLGGVTADASEVEILTDEQADEVAAAEIDDSNLDAKLDELLDEIEADETD